MPLVEIKRFLESEHVDYRTIPHPRTFTVRQTAAATRLPKQEVAKTVLVLADGRLAMAVLPADMRVDLNRLCELAKAESMSIAHESDFTNLFGDCELGAMPPLGALYHLPVYADESLAEDEDIAFNAGTHTELVQIPLAEFIRVVRPVLGKFALPMRRDR